MSATSSLHGVKVWVDVLSLRSFARAAWIARRAGSSGIAYLKVAHSGAWLLRRRRLSAFFDLRSIEHFRTDFRMPDGRGVIWAVPQYTSDVLPSRLDGLLGQSGLADATPRFLAPSVRLSLLKTACYMTAPAIVLAHVVQAIGATREPRPHLVLQRDAAAVVTGLSLFEDFAIHEYGRSGGWRFSRLFLGVAYWCEALAKVLRWHARGITSHAARGHVPQIAVQLNAGIDPDTRSMDYLWYQEAGIPGSQVTVYIDRPDAPVAAKTKAIVEREGHAWLNLRTLSTTGWRGRWEHPYLAAPIAAIRDSWRVVQALGRSRHPLAAWEARHRLDLIWRVSRWEALFRRHHIVALIQYAEGETQALAQSVAIERAGGISVGWHWSHYPCAYLQVARDYAVHFTWGPYYRRVYEQEGSRIEQLVYTGHLSAYGSSKSPVGQHRDQLRVAGSKRVVCFFDSSPGLIADVVHWPAAMTALYRALLEEVVRDPEFGLIVKSKNENLRAVLPQIVTLLERAVSTGRCLVLDRSVPPRIAAASADLVVGHSFNSAGIEAAVWGRRVLHADLEGDLENPFYAWGRDRVVFPSIDRLMAAVRDYFNGAASTALGDHSPVLSEINCFQDVEGTRRMGAYLKVYLEARTSGAGRDEALTRAAADYRRRFGAWSVVDFNAERLIREGPPRDAFAGQPSPASTLA